MKEKAEQGLCTLRRAPGSRGRVKDGPSVVISRRWRAIFVSLGLAVLSLPDAGVAQFVYTLGDNNSFAQIDVTNQRGMFNWSVDGLNVLNQQWFWFRTTSSGPAAPINTISAPIAWMPYGAGGRALTAIYSNPGYNVRVDYLLSGGAMNTSGSSDMGETITVNNTGTNTLSFHLFQYSNFGLSRAQDTVQLGKNLRGLYNEAIQNSGPGLNLTETVVTPGANHGEAAPIGATLAEMASPAFVTLTDNAGPVGPGDVTWAFEWDLSIVPGGSTVISKDKFVQLSLIPEPSSLLLGVVGLLVLARKRRQPG